MALKSSTSKPTDSKLIEAIREGGQSREWAIKLLIEQNIFFVQKLAKQFHQPAEDVLDAYIDAVMVLQEHVVQNRFRGESKLSTYLYKILFNKCRDLLKRTSTKTVELTEWTNNWEPSSRSILKQFIEKEEVDTLYLYLEQIGETCKQILLDWGYWGYKMEEIASRVGLESGDQAKKQKYKCLQKLRAMIAE